MDKHAIALVLDEIGTLLEIHGENRFKARAFTGAARAIETLEQDLTQAVREDRLQHIAGIGPVTAAVIRELLNTGTSLYYRDLRARTPDGLLELLALPHMGATRIRALHEDLGVRSLDDLERAARAGQVAGLKGFGARTEQRILEGIAYLRGIRGHRRYAEVIELGVRLRGFALSLPGAERAELAGQLRRGWETVDALEVVVAMPPQHARVACQAFLALPGLERGELTGSQRAHARLADGFKLQLDCVPPAEFPTRLLAATGAQDHVRALGQEAQSHGLELTPVALLRNGAPVSLDQEADVYRAVGLEPIPPELRETGIEVVRAREGLLPELIEADDLHGCFHNHTTYSDGKATIAQMAQAAIERGWRYLGISDHSEYAGYARGLSEQDIHRQHAEIDDWNQTQGRKLWLFKGIEADILPDGSLDYHDRPHLLDSFDFVIGSVHSAFALSNEQQTQRFLRAIENPYLTLLGHLTGRRLLSRAGCDIDFERVLAAVARRGIGIEINSDPHRMEMDWRHWQRARALGIPTAINPDAHGERQLDFVANGIVIARKGWLERRDIVNCWSLSEVKRFFRQVRRT
ncbi:MAG: helix-hairpin-helix domain-containing protein [Longimicrobiales bacterium]